MKKDLVNPPIRRIREKYKGKKVLIWGLGLHGGGVGSAKFFAKLGAVVLVIDKKSKEQLKKSLDQLKNFKNISYHFGDHKEKDFQSCDFIIRNPDVRESNEFLQVAKKSPPNRRIKIENDIGIFFENSPSFKIGITGTKGKSTVTALIYDLVKYEVARSASSGSSKKRKNKFFKNYNKVFLAGNITKSAFDCLAEADERSIVVLELSSAQLEHARYAKKSPNVGIITNIKPEHIPFHGSLAKYIEAKKYIFSFQKKNDFLIANKELKSLVKKAKSKTTYFNGDNLDALKKFADIFKIPDADIKKVVKNFKGLRGRQEFVKSVKGIDFINDTTATHPLAVSFALDIIKKPVLITGGLDKDFGEEVGELAKTIEKRKIITVLLPGSFSDKIKKKWSDSFIKRFLYEVGSMHEAVIKAYALAKKGDTVLLSPGGASFNLFINEFDRGDKFVEAVGKLENKKLRNQKNK